MSDFPQNLDRDIETYRRQIEQRREWLNKASNARDPHELLKDARDNNILLFQDEMALLELFESLSNGETFAQNFKQRQQELENRLEQQHTKAEAISRRYEEKSNQINIAIGELGNSIDGKVADTIQEVVKEINALKKIFVEADDVQLEPKVTGTVKEAASKLEALKQLSPLPPVIIPLLESEINISQQRYQQVKEIDTLLTKIPSNFEPHEYQTATAWLSTLWVLYKTTDPVVLKRFKPKLLEIFNRILGELQQANLAITPAEPHKVYANTLTGTPMPVVEQQANKSDRTLWQAAAVVAVVMFVFIVALAVLVFTQNSATQQAQETLAAVQSTQTAVDPVLNSIALLLIPSDTPSPTPIDRTATQQAQEAEQTRAAAAATGAAETATAEWQRIEARVSEAQAQAVVVAQAIILENFQDRSFDTTMVAQAQETLNAETTALAQGQTAVAAEATNNAGTAQALANQAAQATQTAQAVQTQTAEAMQLQTAQAAQSLTAQAQETATAQFEASATALSITQVAATAQFEASATALTITQVAVTTEAQASATALISITQTAQAPVTATAEVEAASDITVSETTQAEPNATEETAQENEPSEATEVEPTETPTATPTETPTATGTMLFGILRPSQGNINVRAIPSTNATVVLQVQQLTVVKIIASQPNGGNFNNSTLWYEVEVPATSSGEPSVIGWVHSNLVIFVNEQGTPAPTDISASAVPTITSTPEASS